MLVQDKDRLIKQSCKDQVYESGHFNFEGPDPCNCLLLECSTDPFSSHVHNATVNLYALVVSHVSGAFSLRIGINTPLMSQYIAPAPPPIIILSLHTK